MAIFYINLSFLCLSPSVCSFIGIPVSSVYVFYCGVWSLRVAPQLMHADSLLSGYPILLVMQCVAQPRQVECYSIKLASS